MPLRRSTRRSLSLSTSSCGLTPTLAGDELPQECSRSASTLQLFRSEPLLLLCSTEKKDDKLWVHDGSHMVLRDISFTPGLYKIFDEILVNAADNKVRDPSMNMLKVDIDVVGAVIHARLAPARCRAFRCQQLAC